MRRVLKTSVGNRGVVLALLGLIWMVLGTTVSEHSRPTLIHEKFPLWAAVLIWSVPGAFAVLAAIRHKLDPTAWGLLVIGPTVRAVSYGWGWATNAYPDGWRGLLVWAAVWLLVNRCAAGLDRPAPWDGRERRAWTPQDGR
jgi:hypothetical protein